MRWLVKGKLKWCEDKKYRIDWKKPAKSKIAQEVQNYLKNNVRHYVLFAEYPVWGTRLKIDYLCSTIKIAIEVHGKQHESFVKFFHKTRMKYLSQIKRDVRKEKFLNENGYKLIVIYEEDLPLNQKFFLDTYETTI